MLELEERVGSLETLFGRFVINSENILRRLEQQAERDRQQVAQDRERADQKFAQLQQQAERDRQQAAQDRERADQKFAQLQQQAERDRQQVAQNRERADQKFAQLQQQAERDRQQAIQDRERADQDREQADQGFTQLQQQAERDHQQLEQNREQTEQIVAEIRQQAEQDRNRTEQMLAQMRQQAEQDRNRTEQILAQMRQQAEQDRNRTEQMLAQMRQQAEQDRSDLNKKWGDLANRLGTFAEDIVAPNLPRIAREQFGCPNDPDDFMVRRWVRHKVDNSKRRDFDVVVVYPEKVFINETKATPRLNYIDDFIAVMADIHGYFPEYQGKTIIPIFAGFFIPDNLLRYLTKHKIYALGMGAETMELLNFEPLTPANFT